jgi:hypothetical protein
MKQTFALAPKAPACRRLAHDWPRWVGLLLLGIQTGGAAELVVKAANPLPISRPRQTLELTAAQLAGLGAADLRTVHVRDVQGGEVPCQAVDTDGDAYRKPDVVIFQADFGANETRSFTVVTGAKQVYNKDQFQAYGRFVRERFDDFAWENDRIAHRMYGKALETWAGEPLTSSTVDIWSKRTARLVINDWYLTDTHLLGRVLLGQGGADHHERRLENLPREFRARSGLPRRSISHNAIAGPQAVLMDYLNASREMIELAETQHR